MARRSVPVRWQGVSTVVESNAPDTHARESKTFPVGYRASRSIDRDHTWMFTDGSGSGWHAAAVIRPGRAVRLIARQTKMAMSNVGAEMNGLLLALNAIEPGESVTVVSDYLWDIHYVLGWRNVLHPALVEQVDRARELLVARRPGFFRYIHTRGHRRDGTEFGFWNDVADKLCGAQVAHDGEHSEERLRAHLGAQRPLADLLRMA